MEIPESSGADVVHVEVHVNKDTFPWDKLKITGQEVLDLVKESASDYFVYIKRKGKDDDLVAPSDSVDLTDEQNRHFRTVPKETTEG